MPLFGVKMRSENDIKSTILNLSQQFKDEFLLTEKGKKHWNHYSESRKSAEINWQKLLDEQKNGVDITDHTLLWLLPYMNSPAIKNMGAWTSVAPAFNAAMKKKIEGAGWVKPESWPKVAEIIFNLVKNSYYSPSDFETYCKEFSDSEYSKGFQSGTISPILNALLPQHFAIVNNKTLKTLMALTGEKYHQPLWDYPRSNKIAFKCGAILNEIVMIPEFSKMPTDLFDMFCHWYVAIRDNTLTSSLVNSANEKITLYNGKTPTVSYWRITPGSQSILWDDWQKNGEASVGWDEIGDITNLSYEDFKIHSQPLAKNYGWSSNAVKQLWDFSKINPNDLIIASGGTKEALGVGKVISGYFFDSTRQHSHRIKVDWIPFPDPVLVNRPDWRKTLSSITAEDFNTIIENADVDIELIKPIENEEPPLSHGAGSMYDEPVFVNPAYTVEDCSAKTGIDKNKLRDWLRAINRKKQAIIFGPPGTGKTFTAKELARIIISKSAGFAEILQFHPNYSYEDFIQGIRPIATDDGKLIYKLTSGHLINFCQKAMTVSSPCVLILDEINRANISRVFGEIMYLIEYRDESISLAQGNTFKIPSNVFILGTMNTADRSIALVDHALRRRFAFIEIEPDYDLLERHLISKGLKPDSLISALKLVNSTIDNPDYFMGISYFLADNLKENIKDIWQMEIETYLSEYFFDQKEKVKLLSWESLNIEL